MLNSCFSIEGKKDEREALCGVGDIGYLYLLNENVIKS